MLGLAAPVWLAALAALSVPIALHLWTRRPGRLVRVGSIKHLGGPAPAARRLRLDEPWLLLLRAAVLAALVLALARPYLAGGARPEPAVWALVERAAAGDAVVDSLRLAGAAVRLLEPGLPQLAKATSPSVSDAINGTPAADVWSLLREADHIAPAGTRLVVVATPRLTAAAGERPLVYSDVKWIVPRAAPIDSSSGAPAPAGAQPPADTASLGPVARSATIFAGRSRQYDARYLAAALGAASAGTGESIRLLPADSAVGAAAHARAGDWLVWLADTAIPAELVTAAESGAVVLSDLPDDGVLEARVLMADRMPGIVVRHAALPDSVLTQSAIVPVTLWEDGAGRPLLVARRTGAGIRLDHAGRFAEGSLVLDPSFPELIARLWNPEALEPATLPANVAQALPRTVERGAAAALRARQPTVQFDGTLLLWIFAALLLVGERVVTAHRTAGRSTA